MEQASDIIKRKRKSYEKALQKMATKIEPEMQKFETEVANWYKGYDVFMKKGMSWASGKEKTSPVAAFNGDNNREIEKARILLGKTIEDSNNFLNDYFVFFKKYTKFNKEFEKHMLAMRKNKAYYQAGKFDNQKKAQKTMDLFDEIHDLKLKMELCIREQKLLMKRFQKLQNQVNTLKGKN